MQDIEEVYHKKLSICKEELYEACNCYVTAHHIYLLQIIQQNIELSLL